MKMKPLFRQIWFWLSIIAIGIIIGVISFLIYLYKIELIKFADLRVFITNNDGYYDMQIFWSAISAMIALGVGIVTLSLNKKLKDIQATQIAIQKEQADLHTIPHIMIDSVTYEKTKLEPNRDRTKYKTLENVDYPFFNNTVDEIDFDNMVLLKMSLVNTSEAFARIRLSKMKIEKDSTIIATFNGSTFGEHNHHAFLKKDSQTTIGFVVNQSLLSNLDHATVTASFLLDNNFDKTYKQTQTITFISVSDDYITFMQTTSEQNGTVLMK